MRRHSGGARHPMVQRQEGGTLVLGPRGERQTPGEGEYRAVRPLLPAITLSAEQLAHSLAGDPEFADLVHATMRAEWAVRR